MTQSEIGRALKLGILVLYVPRGLLADPDASIYCASEMCK